MKREILLILQFLTVTLLSAQIKIVDSLDAKPIVGMNMYSDNGILLGLSDVNGVINIDSLKRIDVKHVVLQHIAYENKELSYEDLRLSTNIMLTPRKVKIEEVAVNDKNQYDYVVLKGYFRTYDLLNDKAKYFYDGMIAYYIPLKKKEKVRRKILEYRLFASPESLTKYEELLGKTFSEPPRLLSVERESIIKDLPKGCVLVLEDSKNVIKRDGLNMGFVQEAKTGDVQVYFDAVPPQHTVSRSFFRIKGEQYRGITMENYAETSLEHPAIENLISKIKSDVGAVQRKKKHGYIPMESFSEFYVMERSYLTEQDIKDLDGSFTKSIYLEEKSDYKERFWLDLDRYGIPPLASGIAKLLGSELLEF